MKLSGQGYAATVTKLEKALSRQLQQLQLAERQCQAQRAKEEVLCDFIAHQDMVLSVLEHQQWLAAQLLHEQASSGGGAEQQAAVAAGIGAPTAAAPFSLQQRRQQQLLQQKQQQQQQQQSATSSNDNSAGTQPGSAGGAPPQHRRDIAYVANLLAGATPAQLARVMAMTADDWQQYKHDHFMRLVVLLELINRPAEPSGLPAGDDDACGGYGRSSGGGSGRSSGGAAAAAAASGQRGGSSAWGSAGASAAANNSSLDGFDIPSRLAEVVDEGVTLSFLALFHNHLTIVQASLNTDLQHRAAPPGHWLRVVEKSALRDEQLRQLAAAADEYARVNKACSAEAESLLDLATCPSLLLAAEASIQAASSTGISQNNSGSSGGACDAAGTAQQQKQRQEQGQAAQRCSEAGGSSGGGGGSGGGRSTRRTATQSSSPAAPGAQPAAAGEQQPLTGESSEAADGAGELEESAAEDDAGQLEDLLQRNLRLRFLHMIWIGMFVFNTLTRVQIAQMTVSAYPYYPVLTAICEAAAVKWRAIEEERSAALRRKRRGGAAAQQPSAAEAEGEEGRTEYARKELEEHQAVRTVLLRNQQRWWQQQLEWQREGAPP